jgi:polysaccharide biosynthesis protein PslF
VPLRYGFLSTYPPTQCGLATFTAALRDHLTDAEPGRASGVVRLLDQPSPPGPARPGPAPASDDASGSPVAGSLVAGTRGGPRDAARLLNGYDVAVVQHEYGVYGGPDGDEVIEVLDHLDIPVIVVLHTVLTRPTGHQRHVLEKVAAAADAVVVMTMTARDRLLAGYRVDARRVSVIPHGAAAPGRAALPPVGDRPTVLTWGLIGPGKGIEWGIAAMAELAGLDPAPRYVVAGQTHPKVLARGGETYRDGLVAQARALGLADAVVFDDRYLDAASLADLVRRADVVLLPYDSHDQVTSGVLIEAAAARRPIVATRFPHAVELLSDGAGLLVPHRDPAAIATALRGIITDRALASGMVRAAGTHAPELLWPAVARRYRRLADGLVHRAATARSDRPPASAPVGTPAGAAAGAPAGAATAGAPR